MPGRHWVRSERAGLLEIQDRVPDALDVVNEVLADRPWFRPAVQTAGHLLQMLDRDEDALDLLTEAAARARGAVDPGTWRCCRPSWANSPRPRPVTPVLPS